VVGARKLLVCAALLASSAARPASPAPQIVDAGDYDSFFLWAGVRPQPALAAAKRIYLLQGEVKSGAPVRLVSLRPATPHVVGAQVWLVVRVETLEWPPEAYAAVLRELTRWRAAGNEVVGVQIDFDARTRRLDQYARFLADLRRRLPSDCRLGVTGLLDWSANRDPAGLDALEGTVDELVLQTYQGKNTIPGYAAYLGKLSRLTVPFRIGLLQGGAWRAPATLPLNPRFRGYVVFLHNP
jgi:hypothetical protein